MKGRCTPSKFLRLALGRRQQGGIGALRQVAEIAILLPLHGVGMGYYQLAGFWQKGVPWSQKTGHLSAKQYSAAIDRLNPEQYRKLSQHKLAEKAILRLLGVPSPEFLGYCHPQSGRTIWGQPLRDSGEFAAFLKQLSSNTRICMKPVEGWGGRGFTAFEVLHRGDRSEVRRLDSNLLLSPEEAFAEIVQKLHRGASVIEAYLEQHAEMATFNPSSVNTLRLWIRREPSGGTKILLGYLRIGRADSLVDNQSSGGIVAPLDLNSGIVRAALDGHADRQVYSKHPDHGAQIEGRCIPYFHESLELAGSALIAMPNASFAGADVAITPDGPSLIELNLSPDREGAAFVGAPSARLLR